MPPRAKPNCWNLATCWQPKGYNIYGTAGTAKFLNENGIPATAVCWPDEQGDLNIMDMFSQHVFELVVNIPKDHSKRELTNGYKIRRAAIDHNIR